MVNIVFPELARWNITSTDRRWKRNIDRLWEGLRTIVEDRQAEIDRSGDKYCDLLAILMQMEDYKDDREKIYHELYSFFAAGMITIQYTTLNLIYYLTRYPEYKEKFLAETEPVMRKASDDVVNKLDYETVQDFHYLKCCYQESLRLETPAPISFHSTVTQTTSIGGPGVPTLTIEPGTIVLVIAEEVHKDPTEWRDPHTFNPTRFDTNLEDNDMLLRPDGRPRNPMSFNAFSGGRRICLGKTFAE